MESLSKILFAHAAHAHWFILIAIILAGFNIPISIDLVVLMAAVLAAVVVPEQTLILFLSVLVGSIVSGWCAYWVGRLLGTRLLQNRAFSRLFPQERMLKIRRFYEQHGLWALIVGRFIPFGVRNCIFMSSGMSKIHFGKFVWMEGIACSIWASFAFFLFYTLGHRYEQIWQHMRTFNGLIFAAFSVTVIAFFWYKRRKKSVPQRVATVEGIAAPNKRMTKDV